MLMTNKYEYEKKAKEFLKDYCIKNNIKDISLLFTKEILIEFTYDSDWEWSVKDEMLLNKCSEEEAVENTRKWYLSMTNEELFYERIPAQSQSDLIIDKAEELGFKENEYPSGTYVKITRGDKEILAPLEDYLDMQAYQYGFDSYEDLKNQGYSIDMPPLYDKKGDPLEEIDKEME